MNEEDLMLKLLKVLRDIEEENSKTGEIKLKTANGVEVVLSYTANEERPRLKLLKPS